MLQQWHHLIGDHSTGGDAGGNQPDHGRARDELAKAPPFRNAVAQARLGVSKAEHEQFFRTMLADIDEPSLPFGLSDVHGEGRDISTAHWPYRMRSTNSCGGRRGGWASARQPVPRHGAGIGARYRPR